MRQTPPPSFNYDSFAQNQYSTWYGVDYLSGGSTTSGVDCSHLVNELYEEQGLNYPYTTTSNWPPSGNYFREVCEAAPGRVVHYSSGHMGVSLSNGKVFSAQSGAGEVRECAESCFAGTKRYFEWYTADPGAPPPPPADC